MTTILEDVYAHFGEQLSKDDRLKFVYNALSADHPSSCGAWEYLWLENTVPFDHGCSDPALIKLLHSDSGRGLLDSVRPQAADENVASNSQRYTALVPGCGRGYDAFAFAAMGLPTLGLDISPTAIELANRLFFEGPNDSEVPEALVEIRQRLRFLNADFFNMRASLTEFSLIYDYMFFCALPPVLRSDWAKIVTSLSRPGALLMIYVFPIGGLGHTDGPPYPVDITTISELLREAATPQEIWNIVHSEPPLDTIGKSQHALVIWRKGV